ncbi:MAG: NAD-dependent epimerase/dehydratase family protein [bacterium]|nr:NAD-dependent epimerase/dehydratase family protein [candidate division KSB1 bacterium]MDH7560353.1 NAD-dependent epimerase/dehydratase family protein [bacterium]
MKTLVTGANGFIGSHLVEGLVQQGHQVRCLVRASSNLRWLHGLDIELVQGSLADAFSLEPALGGMQVVFHLAGATKAASREGFFAANTQGTATLLDACRAAGCLRVVFVSSQAAAGPSDGTRAKSELDQPTPLTAYGESKLQAELLVREYAAEGEAVIVRPPVVYGPRDRDVLVLFRYVAHRVCPLLGRGPRLLSIVHVDDLVSGLLLAATSAKAPGNTYFVCNDQPVDWEGFADIIAATMGHKCLKLHVPEALLGPVAAISEAVARLMGRPALISREKAREMRERYWVCDNSRTKADLGFVPKVSIEEGVKQTLAWYKAQGWL